MIFKLLTYFLINYFSLILLLFNTLCECLTNHCYIVMEKLNLDNLGVSELSLEESKAVCGGEEVGPGAGLVIALVVGILIGIFVAWRKHKQ